MLGIGKLTMSPVQADTASPAVDPFEKAVELIKKYETLHQPRHWPLVGYGHKVLPGEKFSRTKALSESQADALLRADLKKNCAVFREFGADSLLLGTLAYNIGSGAVKRSKVVTSLKAGNRDIRDLYVAHSRYRGKVHNQIKNRRIEEFDALYYNPAKDSTLVVQNENLMTELKKGESDYNNPLFSTVSLLSKLCTYKY